MVILNVLPNRLTLLPAAALVCLIVLVVAPRSASAQIEPFVGSYSGSAEVVRADGSTQQRDLSVEISKNRKGFTVQWTTITIKSEDRTKEKSYEIDFVPSNNDLYAAAMKKNLFGHEVQLDPMKGEPYVWSQITGDTLTVYAFFVDAAGGYEIQQYDRTLAEGGLDLEFTSIQDGEVQRTLSAFLKAE